MSEPLFLFYDEPDPDRWLPLDRYPRRAVRRILRGPRRPGGQMRVYLNLRAGLDRIGAAYRVNDYRGLRRRPGALACVIGKPFVLERFVGRANPILFGAAVFSHPLDDPDLFERLPIRRVLVPGPWICAMFEPYYGGRVHAWPVGIDTDAWAPTPERAKDVDVLLYDKVMWDRGRVEKTLIGPVTAALARRGLRTATIRYGHYEETEFRALLARSRAMVFLCEHETQGIAYQQALSSGVPILAWESGGPWLDPSYYPERVRFGPVTPVPYWDDRCGVRFDGIASFEPRLDAFLERLRSGDFAPRDYVLEHLTLEHCARLYLGHVAAARSAGTSGAAA